MGSACCAGRRTGCEICEVVLQLFVAYQVLEIYIAFPLHPLEKKHPCVLTLFMQNKMKQIWDLYQLG